MSNSVARRCLWAILVAGLLLRAGWALRQGNTVDARLPDQQQYLTLARNLLAGNGLRMPDEHFDGELVAYRMPGYPLLIAALGGKVLAVRLAQAALDASTVLAMYLLARRWMGQWPALAAAGLVALNPFLVYFSALLLSETLFVSMLSWGLVLLVWRPNFLWGSGLLAASVLVRPSSLLLPVAMAALAGWIRRGTEPPSRWSRLPVATLTMLLVMAALAPWAMRNARVLGRFVWLTTNGGVTRYDGFNPSATGASDQRFLASEQMAPLANVGELERDEWFARAASEWMWRTWKEDPWRLVRLTGTKIARMWTPVPLSEDYGGQRMYRMISLAYCLPFDLLALAGVVIGRLPGRAKLLLLTPAVYLTVVHALSVGSLRYRLPAEPPLAVLAASVLARRMQPGNGQAGIQGTANG